VYTDRALNHMSQTLPGRDESDIHATCCKQVYNAPIGRRRARQRHVRHGSRGAPVRHRPEGALVIRNGWFSFRWTQIFDMGRIPSESDRAEGEAQVGSGAQAPFAPPPVDEVVAAIRADTAGRRVRTARRNRLGACILPDDYLRAKSGKPCARSTACSCSMRRFRHDLGRHGRRASTSSISAPQKGWSASPCCGSGRSGERARGEAH
jgi:hypothetical protein